jgi:hypothetical protein
MKTLFASIRSRRASFRMFACLLGASASLLSLSGCADEKNIPVDNTAMLPESERVSTVPWNKPENWENTGSLGQLANDPRFTASH